MPDQLGVVAAGHPVSARAGADVLREGGNAVDAALGAMLASFACEPLLTGLGAGGYMLVVGPGQAPALLDFFVEAPGRGGPEPARPGSPLIPVSISFGDAVQEFNIGAASVGTFGMPAGVCEAALRYGSVPLEQLTAPAAALARDGVALNPVQAYIIELLAADRHLHARGGGAVRARRKPGRRRRPAAPARAGRRPGTARRRGRAPVLRGRHRRRDPRVARRARRDRDPGGPRRLRGHRPRAAARRVSRIARC